MLAPLRATKFQFDKQGQSQNPRPSRFLAILEIFCSGVCVRELLAYGTSAPIGRITSFSAKFTDAPLAEGKFETYLHERENAKKPRRKAFAPPVAK